ncbi:hypothetical protein [Varibaculum cambriense]|uniref:hypothetical protein n=1 Tax=Varibaculum cambriense TaxID=184870 RepID=UPI0024202C0B|nr:hypothetical protein [Varibaculum cambriense]MBS5945040.1 hypothetical protein [Varibaculum cambriense]
MKIHLNTRFQYNGVFYEVDNPTDYSLITYVYDSEDAAIPYLRSDDCDFSDFYKLGWTKAEVQEDIKGDWQISYTRQEVIWYIQEMLYPQEMEDFLDVEKWEKFPARKIFDNWFSDDFENAWMDDEDNEDQDHPLAKKSLQRLYKLMETPENLALIDERKDAC